MLGVRMYRHNMTGYGQTQVKSAGQANAAESVGSPLRKLVEKSDEDMVTYYDPRGFVAGEPVNAREKLFEAENWGDRFKKINDAISKGVHPRDAVKEFSSGSVSLPVYVSEDLFISDGERTPLYDGLARVAVETDTVKLDEVTNIAQAESFAEGGDMAQKDDTIEKYEFTVGNQGIVKQVTDKLIHTGRYSSPRDSAIERAQEGIARYHEAQALQGTNNDIDGYEGIADWVDASREFDETDNTLNTDIVRDVITELEALNTNIGDIMSVTDVRSFSNLKASLDDFQRFEQPQDEFSFGFVALEVDGVMIAQSHGLPEESGSRQMVAFDASAVMWAVLADVTVKPLAESNHSQRDVAVYTHQSLVTKSKERIARAVNLD